VTALSEHRLRRRVQFRETDAAGIVHFSVFFNYMEEAEHALWRAAGLTIAPERTEVGWPRVGASFEYYRPLRFEDEFEAHIRIVAMDVNKIHYRCVLWRGEERIAAGELTIASVRKRVHEPMKSIPIPAEVAARLQPAPMESVEDEPRRKHVRRT
jgi:YbgC/YbaW family acyl-CoA thioester hydrolase